MFHIWAPCKPGSIAQSDPYRENMPAPTSTLKTIPMLRNMAIYLKSKDKVASQDPTTRMLSVEPSTPSRKS